MRGRIAGWGAAFAATSFAAVGLFVLLLKGPAPASARVETPGMSAVEVELILNRIREGDLRAMSGDLEAARAAWAEARRKGAGHWPIHEGLGDSFARAKLYDEAVREYLVAEPLVPDRQLPARAAIVFKRAEALGAAGRPLEAIQVYLELDDPARTGGYVLEQALKADRQKAIDLVRRRAEVHEPRQYALLADLYRRLKRPWDAAEASARYCMAAAPWDGDLNRQAVGELRELKKHDLAVEVCRAWTRSVPEALEAWELMGEVLLEAGKEKEAVVAWTSIVDVRPGDAAAHRRLGDLYRKLNRGDDAIAQYEAARKARPEDQVTYSTLAALYEAKGDRVRAEALVLEAMKRFGDAGEFRTRMVVSYQEQITRLRAEGKTEEVRALRRKLADLNVVEAGLFDIKIIMTWDAESDVDLDVIQPDGEHVKDGHVQSKAGGRYHTDNTRGHGPEMYTLKAALPGTYRVGAHLHGAGKRSTVKFVIILWEDTPREERREATLILEKSGEVPLFIPDFVIPR